MKNITKEEIIIKHLTVNKSITNFEAIGLYQDYRLSATVHRLRLKGWKIATLVGFNVFNDTEYAMYTLVGEDRG